MGPTVFEAAGPGGQVAGKWMHVQVAKKVIEAAGLDMYLASGCTCGPKVIEAAGLDELLTGGCACGPRFIEASGPDKCLAKDVHVVTCTLSLRSLRKDSPCDARTLPECYRILRTPPCAVKCM